MTVRAVMLASVCTMLAMSALMTDNWPLLIVSSICMFVVLWVAWEIDDKVDRLRCLVDKVVGR